MTSTAWIGGTARLIAVIGLVLAGWPVAAADKDISAFYGTYAGGTIRRGPASASPRDLQVAIHPTDGGFNVAWQTAIHEQMGDVRQKAYSINFRPTERPGVFSSQMRANKFGNMVPLDPFKGDPFIWARLSGDTLTVYALHITDKGGYDMQVYDRTLTADGMNVHFTRLREGQPATDIEGSLRRVGP